MVVDTFHLFPETLPFLEKIEKEYDFKAEVFAAEGVELFNKDAYDAKYGADLWKEDIEQYDKVCSSTAGSWLAVHVFPLGNEHLTQGRAH